MRSSHLSQVISPVGVSSQHVVTRLGLGGAALGSCIPIAAWTMDILWRRLPYHWLSLIRIHHDNPIHFIIDSVPLMLGIAFTLLGINLARFQRYQTHLEIALADRTNALLAAE